MPTGEPIESPASGLVSDCVQVLHLGLVLIYIDAAASIAQSVLGEHCSHIAQNALSQARLS